MLISSRIICQILGCLFVLSLFLYSQSTDIAFERISEAQGLSRGTVYCLLQDRQGFMWFGTGGGLNRYDGYDFTVFLHDPSDPASLSHNWIVSLCEGDTGTLWVGTLGGGLNRFDHATERFTRYLADDADTTRLPDNRITALLRDRSGIIWIGTGGGLCRMAQETSGKARFRRFQHDPADPQSVSSNFILTIYQDREQTLWIGTRGGGLNRLDRQTGDFTRFQHDPANPHSLSHNTVSAIYEDRQGSFWIGTGNWVVGNGGGLNKFDPRSGLFTRFTHDANDLRSLSHNIVQTIYPDSRGAGKHLWIGTDGGGLDCFDPEEEHFVHYRHDPQNPHSLSGDELYAICEDRSGVIWFATRGYGINKFSPKQFKFPQYRHEPDNPNSLSHSSTHGFWEDRQGILWIGTGGGLNRYDRRSQQLTCFRHEPGNPGSLSHDLVYAICEDHAGALWVGTNKGLNKLDRETGRFTRFYHRPDDPYSLSNDAILGILEDRRGNLWMRTRFGGLNKLDRETGRFSHYGTDPQTSPFTLKGSVLSMAGDRSGNLWLGVFNGGLIKFDPITEHSVHYWNDPDNPNSLSFNSVESIYAAEDGLLWIGTGGGGLNRFDPQAERFTRYTMKDGLPDNIIYGVMGDDHGDLWLSTNRGLAKFHPPTMEIRTYDVSDGLLSNTIHQGGYYQSPGGEMFLGSGEGFNAFYPDSLKDNPLPPPIVLTSFKIFNQPVPIGGGSASGDSKPALLKQSLADTREIELAYDQNFFSFEFAALDYTHPAKNQYAYRLEGVDADWVYCGNRRFASYTQISPGNYTFRVKGTNNDGIWNESGVSLRIIITPPWWKTGWAYTFYAGLLIALVYGLRRFELNRQRLRQELELEHLQAEKLAEIDRMKSRFFANISHEFRTPITLILGPLEKFLAGKFKGDIKGQYEMMHRNARRLLRLINQLLDLSKLESGHMKLQLSKTDIVSFLRQTVSAFESLAEHQGVALHLHAPPEPVEIRFDRDKLEKVLVNLLSNAFKFTERGGSVEVVIDIPPVPPSKGGVVGAVSPFEGGLRGMFEITVRDTGIGISPEHLPHIFDRFYQAETPQTPDTEGTGIGLALAKELVELHGGEISVSSEIGIGAEFTVRLPLDETVISDQLSVISDQPSVVSDRSYDDPDIQHPSRKPSGSIQHPASNIQHPTSTPKAFGEHPASTVLIIEDNLDMRAYIRGHLQETYHIVEAEDGAEGFRKAAEMMPDLIVSDVMMPEMDGFELCAKIKTEPLTSHIPLILLTARASRESKFEGLETGADDYLTKPFDARELQVRVKNLIMQRRKLRERFAQEIHLQPKDIVVTSMDEQFLQKALDIVETHISDPDFDVKAFAKEIGVSSTHLNRKLRALTDLSTGDFIRNLRLKRAARLLEKKSATILEIAYEVGFNNPSYFAECFRKQFGVTPSEYASGKRDI